MTRLIGILVGLAFTGAVLISFITGAYTAATEGLGNPTAEKVWHKTAEKVGFSSDGPFGRTDLQQVQRGYQVYKEVCSACHSVKLVAFRNLAELGYTEAEVKAEAATWTVPSIDQTTGEAATRPALATDYFPSPYANEVQAAAARNPPDLSLITKARHGGGDYVHALLVGYQEQPEALVRQFPDSKTPAGLYYNPYFANLNISMPPPLTADGQVTYADGTEATIDQMSQDVSAFLIWTAEPTLDKRKQTGWPVLGFLLFATVLAYLSKQQVWAGMKPKKAKKQD
jgi:ubiquinol-cytochrome c reductase cytochrome c1 subunit